MSSEPLVRGNLVRWRNGRSGNIGVVIELPNGGRQVRVHFDSNEDMTFAWPTEAVERVLFPVGSQVESRADHQVGVVTNTVPTAGLIVYQVNLAGGASKSILETGLRPALISDPIALLRAGTLHSARSCKLRITATRLGFAHQFDSLSSLSNSRVEIKEHQVAVVHRVATTYPHRFILADEVGLGKTIEAGLIIKELKARGVVNRVLILAPSGIVSQWQFELRTKFNEVFAHFNKASIAFLEAQNPGANVWTLHDNVITSTAYAARDERRSGEIALAGWDLVVIDEAHHARRTREGVGKYRSTNLYRLAEQLANPEIGRSRGYLMLTATPMQLDPFELYSLIDILDPTLFADEDEFERHRKGVAGLSEAVDRLRRWSSLTGSERDDAQRDIAGWRALDESDLNERLETADGRDCIRDELLVKHRLSEVLIRNRKATVGGFMPRVAAMWPVNMTEQEWRAYNAVTRYVRTGYARSRATSNNALGFLMAVFQKLSSSSSYALRQSLLRRIERLRPGLPASNYSPHIEDIDLEERPAAEALDEWLGVQEREDLAAEVSELSSIVRLLDAIEIDTKTHVLAERLAVIARDDPDAKVLLFTQSRDTQEYLRLRIAGSWRVNVFHGQLSPFEKDAAVARFRDGVGAQLLISTEAGGEGRNFQFCHILINYDLPWNPMKIEQRIGRLDRIGQRHPVKIFNFSMVGTIEERVLDVLAHRIKVFEETIGGLDPILGDVENDLQRVFLMAEAEGQRVLNQLDHQLEVKVREARRAEARLADFIMDTRSYRKDEVERLLGARGAVNSDLLRRFTLAAIAELDGKFSVDKPMKGAYELLLSGRFEKELPQLVKEGRARQGTFVPSVAREHEEIEFFAIGHEIVDALMARARSKDYGGRTSYWRIMTSEQEPALGWFFSYVLEFDGVVSSKEVMPVFVHSDGHPDERVAVWLLEHAGRRRREEGGSVVPDVPDGKFESAVQVANELVLRRLMARQTELEMTNRERATQEREKLERFYSYRETAASEKLAAVRRTFDRVSASGDPEIQRIVPVWRKNLENAERGLAGVGQERERRLALLAGRDVVAAQHEAMTASFVEIVPEGTNVLSSA